MTGSRLDALLGEVAAPPLPAGRADRIAAAATLVPQEARPAAARRAWTPRRDRRGAWLRRPLIGAAIALGLAFSGAVAATLAGVPLPEKVAAVMAQLPFVGHKAEEAEQHSAVRHVAPRPALRPARVETAAAEPPPPPPPEPMLRPPLQPRPAMIRRMALAERIVERRQAMGLPTPPVQQVQRMILRRQMMQRWRNATPEQRQAFLANHPRAAAHIEAMEARRAGRFAQPGADPGPTPGPRRMAEARRALRDATPEERQAFLAAHPRLRAMIEARRARRQASFPPTAR